MSRPYKIAAAAMTVLSGIAIYCFFAFRYPYHLHFQEQYQLFESTWDYFAGVAAVPGGFADWLGRFFTQFFYYAPAGAALMAVLLCGVQMLTWAACSRRTPGLYALSFLPAVLLLAFFCDENALAGSAVAIALSLAAVPLCMLIRGDRVRHIVEIVLVPALYLSCGGLAVVFLLAVSVREVGRIGRKAVPAIVAMALFAAFSTLVAWRVFPYPYGRLCYGVHYYCYHNMVPALLWLSALSSVVVVFVSCLNTRELRNKWLTGPVLMAAVVALGILLVARSADQSKEEWMRYDFMVRMQMWNRIMMAADKRNPDTPKTVSCLNLALAKSGRMPDSQFEYFQNGPEGLLPGFIRDHTNPLSTSEIFWHLGMVNTAQRYAFEAQEAIPDFQKSARLYKRLAETNIVNGDESVARKYLKALHNALFYRAWADETLSLLDAGKVFEARPELARARDFRLKEHDFLFSDTEMDSMLGLLKVENSENRMAMDYLMAWCLLRKDLDRFVECISMVDSPTMPKAYQEALLLRWVLTHSDFNGLPAYLSPVLTQRITRFLADARAGKPEAEMQRSYGDTYWFYYYYRYLSMQE